MPSKRPYTVTIDDVARRAGVSISTVSRVVNHTVPVSEEAAARVEAAMTELKYQPRAAARNLATRQTKALGLLLTDISGDFFVPLLRGVEAATAEAGFSLLILFCSHSAQRRPQPTVCSSLPTRASRQIIYIILMLKIRNRAYNSLHQK